MRIWSFDFASFYGSSIGSCNCPDGVVFFLFFILFQKLARFKKSIGDALSIKCFNWNDFETHQIVDNMWTHGVFSKRFKCRSELAISVHFVQEWSLDDLFKRYFADRKSKMVTSQEDVVYYIKWVLPQGQNVFNIQDLRNQYQWEYLKQFMCLFPWVIQKMTTNTRPTCTCSYHRNLRIFF